MFWPLLTGATTVVASAGWAWSKRPARRARLAAERAVADAHRGIEHQRRQLQNAADMAISFTPVDPTDGFRYITVSRVQELAHEHYGLAVSREEAAAMLTVRLDFRNWLGIRTDLFPVGREPDEDVSG